jgi:hypothetical protein
MKVHFSRERSPGCHRGGKWRFPLSCKRIPPGDSGSNAANFRRERADRDTPEAQKFFEKLHKLESEIGSMREVRGDLDDLESAGCDRKKTIHQLALLVIGWDSLLGKIRMKANRLKGTGVRFRKVADEVEGVYRDEETYPDLWLVVLGEIRDGPVIPVSERIPSTVVNEIRLRADELTDYADRLGEILKVGTPVLKRRAMTYLLAYIHKKGGGARKHFVLLAGMISDLYQKYSIKKKCSPESLAKHFERYVKFYDKTPS